MPNLTVAVIGPPGYPRELGKKGTATDIVLYDVKRDGATVSFIEPARYPERLAPLFYSCSMADAALLVVDRVDHLLGECMLMLDSLGVRRGCIVLRNYIPRERMESIALGTVLEGYEYVPEDAVALRERFLDMASENGRGGAGGPCTVPIDHHFNVKGVGTVALGHVARGEVRRHDELRALPGQGMAQVRSIQKHDDDHQAAGEGDRVGLALKGIDIQDLDRGSVLTNDDSVMCELRLRGQASLVRFWPSPLKEGMVVHLGHWMQFLPARLASVECGTDWRRPVLELALEKELVHPPGARAALFHLDGGKLRVLGAIDLT